MNVVMGSITDISPYVIMGKSESSVLETAQECLMLYKGKPIRYIQ